MHAHRRLRALMIALCSLIERGGVILSRTPGETSARA